MSSSSNFIIIVLLFLGLAGLLVAMPTPSVTMATCKHNVVCHQLTEAHHALRDTAGEFPVQCVDHNVVADFPMDIFSTTEQCSRTSLVAYETLRKFHFLFIDVEELPVSYWNETKHDDFLNIYSRILDESCLKSKVVGSIPAPIESFFGNLTTHLHNDSQVDRQCVWEGLRHQLLKFLRFVIQHFDHLGSCLSNC